jgi:TonB family protein
MSEPFSKAFKTSLIVHAAVVLLLLIGPLLSRCVKTKPKEDIIFVELVSPAPPAPPPPIVPVPKPPEPPEPPKPPEPKPPEPEPPAIVEQPKKKEIKVNTNRIVRAETPPPAPPPPPQKTLSAKELEDMLKSALPTSPSARTSAVNPSELSRYYGTIQGILYQAWQQPPGIAGLQTTVSIRIAKNGSITDRKQLKGSGSQAMDESVMRALRSVSSLPKLPDTIDRAFLDVTITFESSGVSM